MISSFEKKKMINKVGIIGGGPSGIIAAGYAASRGQDVTLFEKNERLGKKMYITGKGRCNITNASPIDTFFDNVATNHNFLYSSFYSFTNDDIINLLKENGLAVKVERGNRVFPVSNKSSDVLKALTKYLDKHGVNIMLKSPVKNISVNDGVFNIDINNKIFQFDKLLISTGGKSYPSTGSTGDGYSFAKKLGHTITTLKPSLVPIEIDEDWVKELQGLSLKNVTLKSYNGKKLIHEEFGEMLFAHYGISGPIVLSTSNYLRDDFNNISFSLDLKPALSSDMLDKRLMRDFDLYINKQISNSLFDLLPKKIIPLIISRSKIKADKPVNQITVDERRALLDNIKNFRMKFKSFRPIEEAIVTSGGISTDEINPSTMESKLIPGLYFAGEIIDVDALTGGYNLQIAYSTGYLAGMNL